MSSTPPGAPPPPTGATTVATTWMPPTPIMGGITQVGEKEFSPWTGGLPKSDWSGLDPSTVGTRLNPNQLRPVQITASQKGYNYRSTGLSTKFSRASDLSTFEDSVWQHLCKTGMDTIAYVPDPINPTVMVNVVEEHGRFSVDSVNTQIAPQLLLYDVYDKNNDEAAQFFLLDSLEPELKKEVRDLMEHGEAFPTTFLRLIQLIRSTSIDRFENLKHRIKARKATQYSGQNLTLMAADLRADAKELDIAGQYDHSLTLHMLDAFLEAGGNNNEDFRYDLRVIKADLNAALKKIGYLSKDAAQKYMASQKLTYRDICTIASEKYRNQADLNRWPPARGVSDSRAPPKTFGNVASTPIDPAVLAQAYALIQNGASAKASDECLNCGKKGHWAKDCTQKPKSGGRSGGKKSRDQGGRNSNRNGNRSGRGNGRSDNRNSSNWKHVAPSSGQPTSKTVHGKTWNWCDKCLRWTSTHTADTHKAPGSGGSGSKDDHPSSLQAHFAIDSPSAWNVRFDSTFDPFFDFFHSVPTFWEFWYLCQDMFHLICRGLHQRMWMIFFSACFGYSLGSFPTGFWSFAATMLFSHWSTILPVLGWLLGILISWYGPWLFWTRPHVPFKRVQRIPRPLGPARRKQIFRKYRHMAKTQGKRPPKPPPTSHHGLKSKTIRRMPFHSRHHPDLQDAIARLQEFAAAISFRRVRREGDMGTKYRPKRRNARNPRYRAPTSGLTTSQVEVLTSPVAKAYFVNAYLPDNLLAATHALRAAIISTAQSTRRPPKENTFPVIWDSGASISISAYKSDFVGPLRPTPIGVRLEGLAKGLTVQGVGYVVWSFVDNNGLLRALKLPAYYVPRARVRLLSTNSLLKIYPDETIQLLTDRLILSGSPKKNAVSGIEVLVDPSSNLHIGTAFGSVTPEEFREFLQADRSSAYTTTTSLHNTNLSAAEKELLRWHCRLGHLGFKKIQFLMQSGVLAHSESARRLQASAAKLHSCPMCAACQFGKQRRTTTPGQTSKIVRDRQGALKQDDLFPGQKVSVDHFICSTRGRLPHTFGKEDPKQQYSGGAIFVDHATGLLFVKHQVSMDTHSTIESKEAFEAFCRDHGVAVAEYLSDNGSSFTAQAYRQHLETFSQISRYAGVGAHHHNGVAERAIQTVMSIARTMLLHSAVHWPDVADAALWPLAVDHAVKLYNLMPNPDTGLSPHDLFSKTRWRQSEFQNFRVWGCPVYVLDKTIADGKKLPRWKPRSARQVYVGMSNKHASSVPLCLNLDTGAITPQFHVVFDEEFATIATKVEELPDFASPQWQELFGASVYQYVLDSDDQDTADADLIDSAPPTRQLQVSAALDQHLPPQPLPIPPPPQAPSLSSNFPATTSSTPTTSTQSGGLLPETIPPFGPPAPVSTPQNPSISAPVREESATTVPLLQRENEGSSRLTTEGSSLHDISRQTIATPTAPLTPTSPPPAVSTPDLPKEQPKVTPKSKTRAAPVPTAASSRTPRIRKAPTRYGYTAETTDSSPVTIASITRAMLIYLASVFAPASVPSIFKARAVKDPDTLSYQEAMTSSERAKWMAAAQAEIASLEAKQTWTEVPMSNAKSRIIPGTWVFRRKRDPSGAIRKHKARFCVRGDLEEDDGADNFAPVVAWSTVRLFLVLCFIMGWTTASIDFTNAFVQSTLDSPIWIHMPRGFQSAQGPGTCLRLSRSLYGLRRSPKLFSETALDAFKKLGFVQSKFDPCLLYKKGMMIVMYVDDCGIGAADPKDIDKLVDDLRAMGFELTREGDFSEFLGIKMEKRDDGSIELTQKGLIDKILKATDMEDCKPNFLPASAPLGSDPDGPPMDEKWSYPSIIGMLLYLSTNTRCDIAFAVSQAARFSANPKQSHATAVKSIIRYLKRTRDQGMILKPTGKLDLDLYVDADFCGMFNHEVDTNPDSARSRTGFVIMLSGFPLIWKSQFQSSITCSTLEAEYNALSYSLKAMLPLKRMLIEAATFLELPAPITSSIRARVFEDNQGAFILASNHHITNRTRYYLNKWHWFWDHADEFELVKIDSRNQRADYFTKVLVREPFEHNRFLVQGW